MPAPYNDAYSITYPFDGLDVVNQTVDGRPIDNPEMHARVKAHQSLLFTKIAAYLNLPSAMPEDVEPANLSDISLPENSNLAAFKKMLRDLFFWRSNASTFRKVTGVVVGVLLLPFRLISVIFSTLIHTLMLLTEQLPLFLQNVCKNHFGENSLGAKIFGIWHFIGRAITSPLVAFEMERAKGSERSTILTFLISGLVWGALAALFAPLVQLIVPVAAAGVANYCDINLQTIGSFICDFIVDAVYAVRNFALLISHIGAIWNNSRSDASRGSDPGDAPALGAPAYEGLGVTARLLDSQGFEAVSVASATAEPTPASKATFSEIAAKTLNNAEGYTADEKDEKKEQDESISAPGSGYSG